MKFQRLIPKEGIKTIAALLLNELMKKEGNLKIKNKANGY